MDKQEREMLQEVALRNAISRFRRLSKKAAIPEVGIFWIDGAGTMYAESVSLRDAVDYGEFRTFEGSHVDSWDRAVSANPKWKGLEYEAVPRGRVVYRRDPRKPEFIVYMPKRLSKHMGKVISRFELPRGHVRFDFTDEHYRICGGEPGMKKARKKPVPVPERKAPMTPAEAFSPENIDATLEELVVSCMRDFGWTRERAEEEVRRL